MKTFLIAAITADGFIAKNSSHNPTEWTSKEDKDFFAKRTKEAGVMIMGKNTFEPIGKLLPGRRTIVYSETEIPGVETTKDGPLQLLEQLKEYEEVAICGGATIYTMFMEAGLIDKMYLTIEPVVFGEGMKLFNKELDFKLELQGAEKKNQSMFLEYHVHRV